MKIPILLKVPRKKMDVHFSSKKMNWQTPQWLFDKLDETFHFDIDLAASKHNRKCKTYFGKKHDSLSQDWDNRVGWCNPPYGRKISKWVDKASQASTGQHGAIVMLVPARPDTKWFWQAVAHASGIIFLKGRLKFEGGDKLEAAPFPSALLIFTFNESPSHREVHFWDAVNDDFPDRRDGHVWL